MKKKVLLSSLVTIVLCLCLIAGSTFALFTSTSQVNIAVTSGKVTMTASLDELTLYSAKGDTAGALVDENGNTYSYEEKDNNTFTNGGTAVINAGTLTMELVTPGDKVSFQVLGANTSNVAIQYRYIIECTKGWDLAQGMTVTVNEAGLPKAITTEALSTYTSAWTFLAVGADINPVTIDIELPISAGNEYQELETEYKVTVEAVQSNAVVEDNVDPVITTIAKAADATELLALLADSTVDYVIMTENMATVEIGNVSNKVIDANGHDASFTFKGDMKNVVIKNLVDVDGAGHSVNINDATGDITILDSTFVCLAGTGNAAVRPGKNTNLTMDGCVLVGSGKCYGVWSYSAGDVKITNTRFENMGSWAVLINGTQFGDFVVDKCTFVDCKAGIVKSGVGGGEGSGTVGGNFVFTNNIVENAATHSGAWFGVNHTGSATVSGNTMDGVEWIPGAADGIAQK